MPLRDFRRKERDAGGATIEAIGESPSKNQLSCMTRQVERLDFFAVARQYSPGEKSGGVRVHPSKERRACHYFNASLDSGVLVLQTYVDPGGRSGNRTVNVVPSPTTLATLILPP
jgi:hypothetical protein